MIRFIPICITIIPNLLAGVLVYIPAIIFGVQIQQLSLEAIGGTILGDPTGIMVILLGAILILGMVTITILMDLVMVMVDIGTDITKDMQTDIGMAIIMVFQMLIMEPIIITIVLKIKTPTMVREIQLQPMAPVLMEGGMTEIHSAKNMKERC